MADPDVQEEEQDVTETEALAVLLRGSWGVRILYVLLGLVLGGGTGTVLSRPTIAADYVTDEQLESHIDDAEKDNERVLTVLCLLADEHQVKTPECS